MRSRAISRENNAKKNEQECRKKEIFYYFSLRTFNPPFCMRYGRTLKPGFNHIQPQVDHLNRVTRYRDVWNGNVSLKHRRRRVCNFEKDRGKIFFPSSSNNSAKLQHVHIVFFFFIFIVQYYCFKLAGWMFFKQRNIIFVLFYGKRQDGLSFFFIFHRFV